MGISYESEVTNNASEDTDFSRDGPAEKPMQLALRPCSTLMLRNLAGLTRNQQHSFSTSLLWVTLAIALLALAAVHYTRRRPDSPAFRPKMRIVPVPVRSDNYACEEAVISFEHTSGSRSSDVATPVMCRPPHR